METVPIRPLSDSLKVGDVISLDWEMLVHWPDCPQCLADYASPYAEGVADQEVRIGIPVVRSLPLTKSREVLSQLITDFFASALIPLDTAYRDRFVRQLIPPGVSEKPHMVPEGLYVVVAIEPEPDKLQNDRVYCTTYMPARLRPAYTIWF